MLFVNGLPAALFDFSRIKEQSFVFHENTSFLDVNGLFNIALFQQIGHPEVHYCYVDQFYQTLTIGARKLKIQFLLLPIFKEVGKLINEKHRIWHLVLKLLQVLVRVCELYPLWVIIFIKVVVLQAAKIQVFQLFDFELDSEVKFIFYDKLCYLNSILG